MSRLLSASFLRLRKDKLFWIGMLFMVAAGIFIPVMRYMDMQRSQYTVTIDNGFFVGSILIGIVSAAFCSLFIGTEYNDGTIRNKVVVGHTRVSIYMVNFITVAVASVVMCVVYFIAYLCVGIPLLGFFEMEIKTALLLALAVFMLAIAFSSIFTLISMLNQNKAITAVICIFMAFSLLFIGAQLNKSLNEPETNTGMAMTENGMETQELPNPKYLDEDARKVVQFFYDLLPGGQAIQCTSGEVVNLTLLPVYSLLIIVLTSGVGLCLFKRKELK